MVAIAMVIFYPLLNSIFNQGVRELMQLTLINSIGRVEVEVHILICIFKSFDKHSGPGLKNLGRMRMYAKGEISPVDILNVAAQRATQQRFCELIRTKQSKQIWRFINRGQIKREGRCSWNTA